MTMRLAPRGRGRSRFLAGKTGITEAGADRHGRPAFHIHHARHLRQTLHDGIVVHDDEGRLAGDLGNCLSQGLGKIEMRAFPVAARQVLATPRY